MIYLQEPPAGAWQRFLSNGFRPLFLLCVLQALTALGWWMAQLNGVSFTSPKGWSPVAWHGHEMLFGFGGAAIGGFLLAAVAKWTGRPPVSGLPLALLALWWLAGRVASSGGLALGPAAMVVANTGYWLWLSVLVGREIVLVGNRRNLVVPALLLVMAGFSLAFQLGLTERLHLLESQLLLIALMISLIGGRITPAFTRNWLVRRDPGCQRLPAPFGWVDRLAMAATLLSVLGWSLWSTSPVVGGLLLCAGVLQLIRLMRWRGLGSVAEPLLFALHLGYAWVGIGLLLLGGSVLSDAVPRSAAIHALGVGAMGGMILAVAGRAALGHTNRELKAGALLTLAFIAIHLAALARVLAALWPAQGVHLLMLAGAAWLICFGLFSWRYLPILLGPEVSLSEALRRARGG